MNSPLSPRARRPRRIAAALGSLGLASTLALSGLVGEGVQETEAAWNDTEVAAAEIKAAWPEAFASVVAGSARSANSMINTDGPLIGPPTGLTYNSSFRWTQNPGSDDPSIHIDGDISNYKFEQTWDQNIQSTGELSPTVPPNNLGPVDPTGNSLHNERAVIQFQNPDPPEAPRVRPSNNYCMGVSETLTPVELCERNDAVSTASNTTEAYGFSIGTANAFITFMNAANLSTSATCGEGFSSASDPTGRIDIGTEAGAISDVYLNYGRSNQLRTIWTTAGMGGADNHFELSSGNLSSYWEIGGLEATGQVRARAMPIYSTIERVDGDSSYALSEISAYVEVWEYTRLLGIGTGSYELRAKMYFVLSRSECGVGEDSLPKQASVFPTNGMPGGNDLSEFNGGAYTPNYWGDDTLDSFSPVGDLGARTAETAISGLPPATTVTSPSENTTASETTTSAPPNPGDKSTSSTRTSSTTKVPASSSAKPSTTTPTQVSTPPTGPTTTATSTPAPAIVIPDEPGKLAATARLEDVDTITVGEDELDVVVITDGTPRDATQGAAALEIWLGGGNPSSAWMTFASDDPDLDGWRWAAISQTTGTIVYIR